MPSPGPEPVGETEALPATPSAAPFARRSSTEGLWVILTATAMPAAAASNAMAMPSRDLPCGGGGTLMFGSVCAWAVDISAGRWSLVTTTGEDPTLGDLIDGPDCSEPGALYGGGGANAGDE